jgi:menaquinone-dependent protoporphyrinogen oxidase
VPRILVLYGTTDGHTAKIAGVVSETLRQEGAVVDVVDARARGSLPRAADYHAVIVAASVHAGGYQRAVRAWVRANAAALRDRPSAFISVCLGVLQRDPAVDRDLQAILRAFSAETGWAPPATTIVAGALLYRRYHWLKRWMMRRISARAHGDVDTTRDYEYTDWDALRTFGREFAARVEALRAAQMTAARKTA